jgi:hypothetical protein
VKSLTDGHSFLPILCLPYDFNVFTVAEKRPQPIPQDRMVISDHDPDLSHYPLVLKDAPGCEL